MNPALIDCTRSFRFCRVILPAIAFVISSGAADPKASFEVETRRTHPAFVSIKQSGHEALRYWLNKPENSPLSVESGCFFHPFSTPKGIVVTDLAPSDHLHHRGIFLAWVEMHGTKDADFWGWGEHAPKSGRRIANRFVSEPKSDASSGRVSFEARNDWLAEASPLVREKLSVNFQTRGVANVLDLVYTLEGDAKVRLARWAFSGFCVRTRKDGQLETYNPGGAVTLPNPRHTEPESDWPAANWYDFTLRFDDGTIAGVAVIDHPKNPPTLWHNHRDVRMINPCIVAPAAVDLNPGSPLILRYRVVAHDGPLPIDLLKKLETEWRQ
ncbi:MAG: DUF6807 family protein [Verrucomicrobiota bacterium]